MLYESTGIRRDSTPHLTSCINLYSQTFVTGQDWWHKPHSSTFANQNRSHSSKFQPQSPLMTQTSHHTPQTNNSHTQFPHTISTHNFHKPLTTRPTQTIVPAAGGSSCPFHTAPPPCWLLSSLHNPTNDSFVPDPSALSS